MRRTPRHPCAAPLVFLHSVIQNLDNFLKVWRVSDDLKCLSGSVFPIATAEVCCTKSLTESAKQSINSHRLNMKDTGFKGLKCPIPKLVLMSLSDDVHVKIIFANVKFPYQSMCDTKRGHIHIFRTVL